MRTRNRNIATVMLLGPIFLNFILVTHVNAQDPIEEIRKRYYQTQDIRSQLSNTTYEIFGESSEGGEYKAYRDEQSNLKFIEAKYYGETGKAFYEVYFDSAKVYFIHLQDFYYKHHIMDPQFHEDSLKLYEHRFYFWDNQMIRWIKPDGSNVVNESQEYIDKASGLRDWINEFYYEVIKD